MFICSSYLRIDTEKSSKKNDEIKVINSSLLFLKIYNISKIFNISNCVSWITRQIPKIQNTFSVLELQNDRSGNITFAFLTQIWPKFILYLLSYLMVLEAFLSLSIFYLKLVRYISPDTHQNCILLCRSFSKIFLLCIHPLPWYIDWRKFFHLKHRLVWIQGYRLWNTCTLVVFLHPVGKLRLRCMAVLHTGHMFLCILFWYPFWGGKQHAAAGKGSCSHGRLIRRRDANPRRLRSSGSALGTCIRREGPHRLWPRPLHSLLYLRTACRCWWPWARSVRREGTARLGRGLREGWMGSGAVGGTCQAGGRWLRYQGRLLELHRSSKRCMARNPERSSRQLISMKGSTGGMIDRSRQSLSSSSLFHKTHGKDFACIYFFVQLTKPLQNTFKKTQNQYMYLQIRREKHCPCKNILVLRSFLQKILYHIYHEQPLRRSAWGLLTTRLPPQVN